VPRRTGGRGIGRLLALIAALAACAGCAGEDERADLLVTAPRLFDGERLIEDGAVAIRGDEIVAAGRREDVGVDAARTIALRNATLLPGLIDLHSHDLGYGHIGSVVTTVRDLGTADGNLPVTENRSGPRVFVAGPLITAPGGYPIPIHGLGVAHVVRTADEAREYVQSLASRGADVIKVSLQVGFPMITFGVLSAIVDEAHAHDLRVTAHVGESRGRRPRHVDRRTTRTRRQATAIASAVRRCRRSVATARTRCCCPAVRRRRCTATSCRS
jgi:imidazolonepropionase-like amidohydrolase